jgi:cell division protease FtsH
MYAAAANRTPTTKPVTYSEFLAEIQSGKVNTVRVTKSELIGEIKDEAIDEEVHRLVDECYARSRVILLNRHPHLERIAVELTKRETLDRSALDELLRTCERKEAS